MRSPAFNNWAWDDAELLLLLFHIFTDNELNFHYNASTQLSVTLNGQNSSSQPNTSDSKPGGREKLCVPSDAGFLNKLSIPHFLAYFRKSQSKSSDKSSLNRAITPHDSNSLVTHKSHAVVPLPATVTHPTNNSVHNNFDAQSPSKATIGPGYRSLPPLERRTVFNFLMELYKRYNPVPFHNFKHAFCVAQMVCFVFRPLVPCSYPKTYSPRRCPLTSIIFLSTRERTPRKCLFTSSSFVMNNLVQLVFFLILIWIHYERAHSENKLWNLGNKSLYCHFIKPLHLKRQLNYSFAV